MQEPGGPETARLLPPAGEASPFGLHLVLDGPDAGARGPFVRLSGADDSSPVYLAAVKGDGGTVLELCALKLLPDAPPEGAVQTGSAITNRELEERFERETARLLELRSLSPHFPRLVRADDPSRESSRRLPPLVFSVPSRSFSVPPCPRCRAPLALCRDEEWLLGAGLPPFAASADRFLWCETCARGTGEPVVYTTSQVSGARATVRTSADLLDEIAKAAGGTRDDYAFLTVFGSPFHLTVASPFDLEALADALGGRPWDAPASPGKKGGGAFPPRWAWLGREPAPARRTLFPAESSGLDAVEVFLLKLTAFRQVLEGLIDYYRVTGRPHLDLHPRHLLFDLAGAGEGLPVFWTMQARIHGLAAWAAPLPAPGSPSVVLPGPGLAVPYAAQEVQEFRLAGFRPAACVFTDLEEEGAASSGVHRIRIRGRLTDPYGLYPAPGPRDTLFLSLPDPALGFGFTGLAARAAAGEARSDETPFATDSLEADEGAHRRLRLALGTKLPGARYRVFPDFGTPTDLHALGVSLLRLLLKNDEQDVAAVLKAVERLSRDVAASASESKRDVSLASLLKHAPDEAGLFSKAQVFWGRDDRRTSRPNAIPDALWDRAILLALRLVTRVPGFSVAGGPSDFDPLFREEKLERILPEVSGILAELQALLCGRQAVHLEIQQILAEIGEDERLTGGRP